MCRPPYGPCPHPGKLAFACLARSRQESLSHRMRRRVGGVEIRGCAGHCIRKRPPQVTHPAIEKGRKWGWRDGWDLQSLVFPGRIFPAHTQRLGAPQGAAPGHVHSASECPKDMAVGNRTCIHLEAAREKPAWQASSSQMLQQIEGCYIWGK